MRYPDGLQPVPLSQVQKEDILNSIVPPTGRGTRARWLAHQHVKGQLSKMLDKVLLVPTEEAYEKLKKRIVYTYLVSLAEPGTPAGSWAASATGKPLAQLQLDTGHKGFKSGNANAFEQVKSLVIGTNEDKFPRMRVFFQDPNKRYTRHFLVRHRTTFQDLMRHKYEMEQTLLADVVDDYETITYSELKEAGEPIGMILDNMKRMHPAFYNAANLSQIADNLKIGVLYLNTYRMYSHHITMYDIANTIEGKGDDSKKGTYCSWISQRDGHMYLFMGPEAKKIESANIKAEFQSTIFFNKAIYSNRDSTMFLIKGIPDCEYVDPVKINIVDVFTYVATGDVPGQLIFHINIQKSRMDGITIQDMYDFLALFSLTPVAYNEIMTKITATVPAAGSTVLPGLDFGKPKELLNQMGSVIRQAQGKYNKEKDKSKVDPLARHIVETCTFFCADVKGSNWNEISWRPEVDKFHSHSMFPNEIVSKLDIEGARYFMKNTFQMMTRDRNLNIYPGHISLIFDCLTCLGIPNKMSQVGSSRREAESTQSASISHTNDVFIKAAVGNREQKISSVSGRIFIGDNAPVGTAAVQLERAPTVVLKSLTAYPIADEATNLSAVVDGMLTLPPSLEEFYTFPVDGGEVITITQQTPESLVTVGQEVPVGAVAKVTDILEPPKESTLLQTLPTTQEKPDVVRIVKEVQQTVVAQNQVASESQLKAIDQVVPIVSGTTVERISIDNLSPEFCEGFRLVLR